MKLQHLEFFNVLKKADLGEWEVYQLLRVCGVPKLSHVFRNLPPSIFIKAEATSNHRV